MAFKHNIKDMFFFSEIFKILKTSMCDYEKSNVVTYPFYFIN